MILTWEISPGQPKKFEDKEVKTLLNQNPNQTQEELAKSLNVDRFLKVIGMIQKQGN